MDIRAILFFIHSICTDIYEFWLHRLWELFFISIYFFLFLFLNFFFYNLRSLFGLIRYLNHFDYIICVLRMTNCLKRFFLAVDVVVNCGSLLKSYIVVFLLSIVLRNLFKGGAIITKNMVHLLFVV